MSSDMPSARLVSSLGMVALFDGVHGVNWGYFLFMVIGYAETVINSRPHRSPTSLPLV